MCGIAAVFPYHDAAPPVDPGELERIVEAMVRRGPDGRGVWISEDERVGLGHRRLAILDLTARAAQPMASDDEGVILTFNGEIYNHAELRRWLEARGHRFYSTGDTEVIVRLYEEKGEAMLRDLRGMFALVLYDRRRNAMLLARDPYGIKPLYYTDDGWTVRAASMVSALLAGGRVPTQRDPAATVGFFLFGSVPEPFTCYRAVRALPAGHFVWVGRLGASEPRSFATVNESLRRADARPAANDATLRAALSDSVAVHQASDVPVGVFLSAGIDSAAVLSLLRERSARDLYSVTVRFDDPDDPLHDEAPVAELMARSVGAVHRTRLVTADEVRADLDAFFEAMDQPTIDGLNTWFAAKAAQEGGLKVMLSGVGGDELFGGYPSFRDVPRWVAMARVPGAVPGLGRAFRWLASRFPEEGRSPKRPGFFEYGGTFAGAYLLRRGLFMPWEIEELLGREIAREGLARLRPLDVVGAAIDPTPASARACVAALESSLYLRNQLLRDSDWASMAHSVELRAPLVDATLLDAVAPAALPTADGSKRLLRRLVGDVLPTEVSKRGKTGFHVPLDKWLKTEPDLDAWRASPMLRLDGCPWARRWAYAIASRQGLLP